jgi:AcrR family transcriptional regulator
MPKKRLTRQEQQQRTRSSLMEAASKVFACKGMQRASVDEVAEEAGYTKGAFYANFKSKEELFLAMLDERFADRLKAAEEAFATEAESPPEQARHAAEDFTRAVRSDPEAERLFIEFANYALQNEDFRQELLTRFATLRKRMGEIFEHRAETYGIEPPVSTDRMVRMVIAMADGWAIWRLLEPEAIDNELFESMVEIFTVGIGVMGGALDPSLSSAPDGRTRSN